MRIRMRMSSIKVEDGHGLCECEMKKFLRREEDFRRQIQDPPRFAGGCRKCRGREIWGSGDASLLG